MNFSKALELLEQGRKVKHVCWGAAFLEKRGGGIYYRCSNWSVPWGNETVDFFGDYWELYQETFNFTKAVELLEKGEKLARKAWPAYFYCWTKGAEYVILDYENEPMTFDLKDLTAADWIIWNPKL